MVRICVYTGDVNPKNPSPPPITASGTPSAAVPHVTFAELSAGRREVHITHAGQVYRLSLTSQNKLLLTK
jgi:hemin uptake protein HemP